MINDDAPPSVEAFLKHYGVKGMKWGRRKAQNSGSGSGSALRITRKQNRQMNREARKKFDEKKMTSIYNEAKKKGDKVLIETMLMGTTGKTVVTGKEFTQYLERGGAMNVRTTEVFARQNKSGQYEANQNRIGNYRKQNFRS